MPLSATTTRSRGARATSSSWARRSISKVERSRALIPIDLARRARRLARARPRRAPRRARRARARPPCASSSRDLRVVQVAQEQQHRVRSQAAAAPRARPPRRRSPWRATAASRGSRRTADPPATRRTVVDQDRRPPPLPRARIPRARRAGSASGRRSPADGERRLTSAIAARPGPASASRNLMPMPPEPGEKAISSSSRSPAAPESIASRASPTPSRRSAAWPAAAIAPAALSTTAERRPPSSPAKTARIAAAFSAGEPPRSSLGSQRGIPRSSGSISRSRTRPSTTSQTRFGPAGESSSIPAGAVDDEGAPRAELGEHVGDRAHERRRVDADDLRARAGRVGQRPEHVEDRPRRELAAHRSRVPHRRMMRRREQEAEAELVDRALDLRGRKLELGSRAPRARPPTRTPTRPRGCRASRRLRRPPPRRAPRRSRC